MKRMQPSGSGVVQKPKKPRRKWKGRGNGSGTVWKEGDVYRWQFTLGYTATGKRIAVGGQADTKIAAEAELAQARSDHHRKVLPLPNTCTVNEYVAQWLSQRHDIEPRTVQKYGAELSYALEMIGKTRLQDVTPAMMRSVVTHLHERPMRHGQPMARQTLGRVLTRLRAVFADAVVDRIIYVDPMVGIKKRKIRSNEKAKIRSLDAVQEARFVTVGHALHQAGLCRLWPLLHLMLNTGLRRGEIVGLKWKDIDWDAGTIRIVRARVMDVKGIKTASPKTENSERSLPIPPTILQLLRDQRDRVREERAQLEEAWTDRGIVFPTSTGDWTHPDNVNRALRIIVDWSDPKKASSESAWIRVPIDQRRQLMAAVEGGERLPHISAHDLRHTYATLSLQRGIPVNVVSKALGHGSVAITLSIYRHVFDDEVRGALAKTFQPIPTVQQLPERVLN